METLRAFISLQIILGAAHGGLRLMSDYKACGDPACERMMSRVQALRDHRAPDCRFLSFKKGDMITVYYKLTGKRSDLWAGSIDKQSGYFPKDAARIDEVFVDEEKEIKMPTQTYDFLCMDEFGSIIESDSNEIDNQDDQDDQDDQEDQTLKPEELGNSDFDDPVSKSAETNHNIHTKEPSQYATEESSEKDLEQSEKSGSSWIGSAVNGWFGGGGEEESHEKPPEGDGSDQASFKGRKLALDFDETRLQEEKQAKASGWIGNGLTNVFEFGQKASEDKAMDSPEDLQEKDENPPSTQSSWLDMGIKSVWDFAGGDNPVKSEAEDKNGVPKDGKNIEPTQPSDSTETSTGEPNHDDKQDASTFIEENMDSSAATSTESKEPLGNEDSGWYGRVYNKFSSFYEEAQDKNGIRGSLSGADVQQAVQSIEDVEDKGGQETDAGQSLFIVSRLSTVFDGLKSQFQSDAAEKEVQSKEEKPPEQADAGKEVFDDQQINKDEESTGDDNFSQDLISETQPLSDEVSSFSDDVRESKDFSQEPSMKSDDAHDNKEEEIPEETSSNEIYQTEINGESAEIEQSQAEGENKENMDHFGKEVSHISGFVDSDFSELSENLSKERFPNEEPKDLDLLEVDAEFDPKADHAEPSMSIDQRQDIQSVLNNDETEALTEHSELNKLIETDHLGEALDQNILNVDNKTKTVHVDTFEAPHMENLMPSEEKIDTSTPESHEDDVKSISKKDINKSDPRTDGFTSELSTQENPKSVMASANNEEVAQDSLDADDELLLDSKTNEFSSYTETDSHSTMIDIRESIHQKVDETFLGSRTERTELTAEKESVDVTQEKEKHFGVSSRSEKPKEEEGKHGTDPDGSIQEYVMHEKIADATLGQAKSQPSETPEKIPSKQSTASENASGFSGNNAEHSDHVSLDKHSTDQTVLDISPDNTKDIPASEKSGIHSENENKRQLEEEKLFLNTGKEEQQSNHVSLAKDANTENASIDVRLDTTEDIPPTDENVILSENKKQEELEDAKPIQNASTLKEGGNNHVSLASDANTDHTALDLSVDSTEYSEECGILSENEIQEELEEKKQIQNYSEDASTLELEQRDHVRLAKDAITGHTTHEFGLHTTKYIQTSEKSGILSENEKQEELEVDKQIQNDRKDASKLDGKQSNHVSLASDADAFHAALDINEDKSEDIPTPSENINQKVSEHEKAIQAASEDSSMLEREYSNDISFAEDANTDNTYLDLDSNEDIPISEENTLLSEHDNQGGLEYEEPMKSLANGTNTIDGKHVSLAKDGNADHVAFDISLDSAEEFPISEESDFPSEYEFDLHSVDANTLGSDNGVELNRETSSSHITEEINDTSIIEDPMVSDKELDTVEEKHLGVSQRPETSNNIDIQNYGTRLSTPVVEPQKPTSKQYSNLQASSNLSEEDIKDLLEIFGEHRLSWLDRTLGQGVNVGPGQAEDNEDLPRLSDFEQMLEYCMKTGTRKKEDGLLVEAFVKVDALLSTLREKLMPVVADGSVDKGPDATLQKRDEESSESLNEEIPDVGKVEDSLSTNNTFSDEQGLSEGFAEKDPDAEEVYMPDENSATSDWITSSKSPELHSDENLSSEEPEETKNGIDLYQYAALVGQVTSDTFAYVLKEGAHLKDVIYEVVSSLPDDIRPGPDLYGLPWEVVLFTAVLGLLVVLVFSCRFIQSIKSRLYASKESRMGQKVAELLEEKCKVLETLSECKHKFDKLETALQNGGVSAQASEKENLEVMSKKLEESNAEMRSEIERLQDELGNQSRFRKQQEEQLAELEETLKNLEAAAKEHKSQLEQDKTTLKVHEMNSERLQKKLHEAKEENTMLLESKAQLVQEAEGWGERLSELEEEMRMCERSHASMVEDCTNKDERIKSLTDCLLKVRDWDPEEESSVDRSNGAAASENGDPTDLHQTQKVQKLIFAAKMSADLKAMEEDKDRVFAKLADEIKAKEDLQGGIEQMQKEKESLESESSMYSEEIQKLQQKLQIMTEMYQENELKLHRMLTVEERERSQKEEKLTKAGKKISLAAEELNTYRQRAKELEEELDRTNQAYKNQIASHEKKAHDNWLAARAADRDLADVKRENSLLRQRLTDYQFKLEIMEKDPYAREAPARPVFRGERSPYGPSPLGRPSSETRAFLSPPTLMDGPLRLSPQFPMVPGGRVSRGVVEPPAGGLECDRSGPHSDSGSASPSWERERRGPGPPPGPPPPDPGMPYRRPPPGPFPMGPRPPPPESYFGDKSDLSFLGNSSGPSENESRDSLPSVPGDARAPPDADMRMGPSPGPPMGLPPLMDPRDPLFPHRIPYRPPDYFPLRGPGGPPLGMRGLPPPGMFPRTPLPHPMAYPPIRPPPDGFLPGPPLRLPPPDDFLPGPPLRPPPPENFQPGPPPRPQPQGSEQPPEQPPSPHDII